MQGDKDVRVKKEQSDRIVEALKKNGVPVHYLLLLNEGHGFSRNESRLAAYAATDRFLDRYLFGDVSVKVVPSLHSALNGKHYYDGRVVPRDFSGPRRMTNDVEGGTLAYLIRLAGRRLLWFGSMNYLEREVEGLRPDVALIAAARQRLEIHDYTGRLMRALGRPRLVFATHWDEQSLPYGAPQDQRLREAALFVKEVKAVSPRTRVVIPRHFETHVVPARRR